MSFVDELREQEELYKKENERKKASFDSELINEIILTIRRECQSKNKTTHRVKGIFEHDSWGDYRYQIQDFHKEEIPIEFAEGSMKRVTGFVPTDPDTFEMTLKSKISALGFNASKCVLIPVIKRKRIGTNFLGMNKYERNTIYVIWIDLEW